jgi:hypothetical protein
MLKLNEKYKNSLFSSNSNHNSKKNLSSFVSQTQMKHSTNCTSKKELNIIDFIKQKNKFTIKTFFDEKGTKKFLASKDLAMQKIEITDDIPILINKKVAEPNPAANKKSKNKKVKFKNDKNFSNNIMDNDIENNNNIQSANISINNNIYNSDKNIIKSKYTNDNKSIKTFHKKLKSEETKKDKKNKKNKIYKSLTNKKNKYNNGKNPFFFSKAAKKLMKTEDLNISGIDGEEEYITDKKIIKTIRTYNNSKKKVINQKNFEDTIKNEINMNSDKESLINLLSNFM